MHLAKKRGSQDLNPLSPATSLRVLMLRLGHVGFVERVEHLCIFRSRICCVKLWRESWAWAADLEVTSIPIKALDLSSKEHVG